MRGLLLDFGGVLVDAPVPRPAIVPVIAARLAAAGAPVPSTVDSDVRAGLAAYVHRCEASVRLPAPAEVSHVEFWTEYVAADWPAPARTVLAGAAGALSYELIRFDPELPLRQGIRELLAAVEVPVAIVSNTMCGAAHRDYLAALGLGDRFAAQLYSDEAGIRKPNPELIRQAAKAIDVAVEDCWYVGDTWSRDVRCGRRAGVGTVVLMRSSRTSTEAQPPDLTADLVLAAPVELRAALVR